MGAKRPLRLVKENSLSFIRLTFIEGMMQMYFFKPEDFKLDSSGYNVNVRFTVIILKSFYFLDTNKEVINLLFSGHQ